MKSTLADNPALTIELVRELIFCVDSLVLELDDSTERFNVYNILSLLCNFTGNQALARYYQLCADYIYNVEVLMTEPYHTRFSEANIQKFRDLLKKMELMDINRYGRNLKQCRQVIRVMQTLYEKDSFSLFELFYAGQEPACFGITRYFSIVRFLRRKIRSCRRLSIKASICCWALRIPGKKRRHMFRSTSGMKAWRRNLRHRPLFMPIKMPAKIRVSSLLKIIASFMNTDGGTLYIGVNDKGYLNGLAEDLKFARNDSDVYLREVNRSIIYQLGEKKKTGTGIRKISVAGSMNMKTGGWYWPLGWCRSMKW